jgi:hypothetical protein
MAAKMEWLYREGVRQTGDVASQFDSRIWTPFNAEGSSVSTMGSNTSAFGRMGRCHIDQLLRDDRREADRLQAVLH